MQELRTRQERLEGATEAICGPGSVPGACLAGMATLLLGAVCLADAFVAPGLFGPLAAAVIAAERLLCAVRSSSTRTAMAWTGIALCWLALATCMVHTPLISMRLLQWLLVAIIASSTMCRLWTRIAAPSPRSAIGSIGLIAVSILAQLAMLFGGTASSFARVAAAAAIELVLIGALRLLEARRLPLDVSAPSTGPDFRAPANLSRRVIEPDTGAA
jgi:hypothetical protein